MEIYNEELRKHLHLIYDPDDILSRVSMNPDLYVSAKSYYLIELQKFEKYKEPGMYAIQMLGSKYITI